MPHFRINDKQYSVATTSVKLENLFKYMHDIDLKAAENNQTVYYYMLGHAIQHTYHPNAEEPDFDRFNIWVPLRYCIVSHENEV